MTAKTGSPDSAISWTSGRVANSASAMRISSARSGLKSPTMGEDKIASFYNDPVKQACDAWSSAQSFSFRKVTMEKGPYWQAQRWAVSLPVSLDGSARVRCGGRATGSAPHRNSAPGRPHLQCRRRPDRDHGVAVNADFVRGGGES